MRKWFIIAAVLFQGLVLAYMAGEREYVILTGDTVYLRTAPIDPRDIFRGDYVRLNYEISRIPRNLLRDDLALNFNDDDPGITNDLIYVALKTTEDGLAEVLYASDRKPEERPFIRGRLVSRWSGNNAINILYGIEAYFVQQGKGLELERRNRESIRIPLEMEIALGRDGTAIIKNHRWNQLGLGIELEMEEIKSVEGRWPPEKRPKTAKMKLLNGSEKPLAIVDLPGGRSFSLLNVWGGEDWRWINADTVRPSVQNSHVHVLQPGEIHYINIDLRDRYWFLVKNGQEPRPLSKFGLEQFQLIYCPPSKEECQHLSHADLIWHGRRASRTFRSDGVF